LVALALGATASFAWVSVAAYAAGGWTWAATAGSSLSLLACVGLVDLAWSRIALFDDELEVRTLWARRRYAAPRIASVTWEAGCGVALKLSDGSWATLPDLGYNARSLTQAVREWLTRTKSSAA
jgi:hypothetical protein